MRKNIYLFFIAAKFGGSKKQRLKTSLVGYLRTQKII